MQETYETRHNLSTLDEPISETLLRDLRVIGRKLLVVIVPQMGNDQELRDWDLWGPLLLCLIMAIVLSFKAKQDQASLVFSAIFVLVWVGSAVVTLNSKFLGSKVSFFQTVCVMGYCLAPICIATLISVLVTIFWVTLALTFVAWVWSTWASLRFFRGTIQPDREYLVVYPVGLFFFFISWMVIVGI